MTRKVRIVNASERNEDVIVRFPGGHVLLERGETSHSIAVPQSSTTLYLDPGASREADNEEAG